MGGGGGCDHGSISKLLEWKGRNILFFCNLYIFKRVASNIKIFYNELWNMVGIVCTSILTVLLPIHKKELKSAGHITLWERIGS